MAATKFDMVIWEEDSDVAIEVVADQRDMAAFELEFKIGMTRAMEEMQIVFFRFIAWHALRRTGRLEKGQKRSDWEAKVVEVEPKEEEQTVDPGKTAASEETSSGSL